MKGEWEYNIKPRFKPGNKTQDYAVAIPAEAFGQGQCSLDDTEKEPFISNGRIQFGEWVDISLTFAEPSC